MVITPERNRWKSLVHPDSTIETLSPCRKPIANGRSLRMYTPRRSPPPQKGSSDPRNPKTQLSQTQFIYPPLANRKPAHRLNRASRSDQRTRASSILFDDDAGEGRGSSQ